MRLNIPQDVDSLVTHPWLFRMIEPPRMAVELGALVAMSPLLVPMHTADGHPVLIVPGISGGNHWTLVMRTMLKIIGHTAHGLPRGAMQDSPRKVSATIARRVEELAAETGDEVSLVGWSVGGAFVRQAARRKGSHIRQVVTLGTPLDGWWYPEGHELHPERALPVPSTAIYSRTDGIMDYKRCLQKVGPQTENVEVFSSHFGMATNPFALHVVADRVGQPAGTWRRYHRPLI